MLFIIGDPHGQFTEILRQAEAEQPEALIFLGDQTPGRPLPEILGPWAEKTWYILGNHDSDLPGFLLSHWGVMGQRNLHAQIRPIAGHAVAGLGGVFRGQIWRPPDPPGWTDRAECVRNTRTAERFMGGPTLRHWTSIFPEDLEALRGRHADILVTHEAPTTHRHGFQVIDDLARSMGVGLIVHGHHHEPVYQDELLPEQIDVVGLGMGQILRID